MCPLPDTGMEVEIGMRTTINMVMEMDGRDAEIMEGWGREDAGNNRIQGAVWPPDQQNEKLKIYRK